MRYDSGDNLFNLSSLKEYCQPVNASGFAVKFVVEGIERYTIDKQAYCIQAGSYLLLNGTKEARVEIGGKNNVKGICINISSEVIADVVASFVRPDTPVSDPDLAGFFYTSHFLENQYSTLSTLLGSRLLSISNNIYKGNFSADDINMELFFALASSLVADQVSVFRQLQAIPAIKPDTRRDLVRRIIFGKEFMDTFFMTPLTIAAIAKEVAMSEFHFFRLFKKVNGMSPYQYIISKRLQAAGELLKNGCSITETAIECGFSDVHTFSKAFKKHHGFRPSMLKEKNSRIKQAKGEIMGDFAD